MRSSRASLIVAVLVGLGASYPDDPPPKVEGPDKVAADELAGVVVDPSGKPVEGAEVDAWSWYPGNETKTDRQGAFRLRGLDKFRKVELIIKKPGYAPRLFLMEPTGKPGWVVTLDDTTYLQGKVTGPDGKPVAGALIRANRGPKMADGVQITDVWTEAKSGPDGSYRMHAEADTHDIQVRMPGVGVARLSGVSLANGEAKTLDIPLQPGATFRAKLVDADTQGPVANVRFWHWQHKGVEGRSDKDGLLTIPDMMPGKFDFMVEADGYARWWSPEAVSEWSRKQFDPGKGGWQRNFDSIDFNLAPDMAPVTIEVERAVKVTGRVVDPDGKPVAGATVAPALTGTGNSLTGDTRFSVETGKDGTFTMKLPASGGREYNLIAHDGKYGQWRAWANGVLPAFGTTPGQKVPDVELKLTRGATVRGQVLDAEGKPVANREVRASAGDKLENRYYDPTVSTDKDGAYTLKFVRPGEQFIQVHPFWLDAQQAPRGTSHTIVLKPGETKGGVDFQLPKGR